MNAKKPVPFNISGFISSNWQANLATNLNGFSSIKTPELFCTLTISRYIDNPKTIAMLLDISAWWDSLVLFEKILWGISLLFSLLFLFQTILTLSGGDADSFGDADAYADGDEGADNQYFTIKNLIAFFTMFGWVGIAANSGGLAKWLVIVFGLIAGSIMVFLMVLLFRYISRLKHSGTMEMKNAVDQIGETYLFIPGGRNGIGKVHVKFQGSLHELQAMTDDSDDIPTGKIIRVTGVLNDSILLVTAYTRF